MRGDRDAVARCESHARVDASVVHEGAAGRADVFDEDRLAFERDARVRVIDGVVDEHHLAVGIAPDAYRPVADRELRAVVLAAEEPQDHERKSRRRALLFPLRARSLHRVANRV